MQILSITFGPSNIVFFVLLFKELDQKTFTIDKGAIKTRITFIVNCGSILTADTFRLYLFMSKDNCKQIKKIQFD